MNKNYLGYLFKMQTWVGGAVLHDSNWSHNPRSLEICFLPSIRDSDLGGPQKNTIKKCNF